ncbi:NuoM family protein [Planctomyces sp. SH-PL62]|uniref:complex I subunit 4 family protein n=1 Tax=Planctomyces sp. SH-PL62 TaxID=1636152 RepID=UPI00078D1EA1|nr:NADH-quinone oxidoreductase subunit M [Planctomyces sp. SH-PL62]AMV36528.1 NADH-quinone oxidoreductase subunit M [Planctomyces sp. SH-PL62]
MSDNLLLTSLWLVPLIGAGAVLLMPRGSERLVKYVATGFTAAGFLLTLVALFAYVGDDRARAPLAERAASNVVSYDGGLVAVDESRGEGDLVVRRAWIPAFNIQYYLGLDGVSVGLVVLTGLVSLLACLASWGIEKQVRGYYSLFLLLVASMTGVFLALDLFLFYVFFEVMLLPMYFLIALWGGEDREYAAIKFLLYTLFGSVFILVAILILYFWPGDAAAGTFRGGTFDILALTSIASTTGYYGRWIQDWIFALFLIGFLVKLPSFPFHTWLPDAHVQAPTPISMILAGVLLKVGGYGLIRLAWPLAPAGAFDWSYVVAALGVFSILYGALAAMAQTDFKKLVAYSSVSHMGYVTLGLAVMNLSGGAGYYAYGVNGAMYMMLAHGVTSAAMFFLVGVIYERAHTRDLDKLGGLNDVMPVYGAVSYVIFFGSMGLPGLCGFVAEIFVVLAAFHYSVTLGVLAAAAVVLTAGYILWTLQRVFLGRNETWKGLPDLTVREIVIAAPLVVLTVLMGIFPQPLILRWMSPSVDRMVQSVAEGAERNAQGPMALNEGAQLREAPGGRDVDLAANGRASAE